jgi:hypothetical protein
MGWSVWWDRRIIVRQCYDQGIERELEAAKSVVVLWSAHSIGFEWVRNEAAVGARRGVLVPAMLERVQLPLEFSRKQTADLTGWNGDPSSGGFQVLYEGVATVLGSPSPNQRHRSPRLVTKLSAESVWRFGLVPSFERGAIRVPIGGIMQGHSTKKWDFAA